MYHSLDDAVQWWVLLSGQEPATRLDTSQLLVWVRAGDVLNYCWYGEVQSDLQKEREGEEEKRGGEEVGEGEREKHHGNAT